MPLGEFALIERYFRAVGVQREDVAVGVGDDGAVLTARPGMQLVAVTDTLVEAVHFHAGAPAASIGHRALAVNLSDLAAMGAEPAWALLALTLPDSREEWLAEFARGFGELARAHGVALVGGDTTRGPLTVTVHALGFVPAGGAMLRSGGAPGDALYVTGTPGDAAGGLALESSASAAGDAAYLRARLRYPQPRCALGMQLRSCASACIDVSDGLAVDAGKLATASGCGVQIALGELPLSPELVRTFGIDRARELALAGGDDYELLFTVSADRAAALERAPTAASGGWRKIGALCARTGIFVERDGAVTQFSGTGYDHFAAR